MHRIIALALLGLTALSGPAWSQANIRPDPDPRVPSQPGQALPREDALFLSQAASASQGQAELGRLAAEKAPDDTLRSLAQRIAETHAKLAGDLKRLTDSRTLPPADQLQPERTDAFGAAGAVSNPENARGGLAQEAVQSLSGQSGGAFGKGYVEAQLRLHDRLVDLYQTQASHTPDRELATFAITSLVAIQKDRDALRQMAGQLGIKTNTDGQAIQYGDPTKAR
jgi:predicted outer membrane protein